jgi:hypothetical protein
MSNTKIEIFMGTLWESIEKREFEEKTPIQTENPMRPTDRDSILSLQAYLNQQHAPSSPAGSVSVRLRQRQKDRLSIRGLTASPASKSCLGLRKSLTYPLYGIVIIHLRELHSHSSEQTQPSGYERQILSEELPLAWKIGIPRGPCDNFIR